MFIILGSGARENIILKNIRNNSNCKTICISNYINPQIESFVSKYIIIGDIYNKNLLLNKILEIKDLCQEDLIVIPGSENFLNNFLVDELLQNGIDVIGPKYDMAKIETSKIFCREYLRFNHLDNYQPKYFIINSFNEDKLINIFISLNNNFVVKDDGLKGGKGVKVFDKQNCLEALSLCYQILESGNNLLIEERLYGEEFSLISFCDGMNIIHCPPCQDFKDVSLNVLTKTGGMGSIILSNHSFPFLSEVDLLEAQTLNYEVMKNLSRENTYGYRGFLYGSYMKTDGGIKLIEFNARMGDPECLNIISLLENPLEEILLGIKNQSLDKLDVTFKKEYSICKYIVPKGYPTHSIKNKTIDIKLGEFEIDKHLYLASIYRNDCGLLSLGGSRSIGCVYVGSDLNDINNKLNYLMESIEGPVFYRKDVGEKYINTNLENQNINNLNNNVNDNNDNNNDNINDNINNNLDDITYDKCGVNIEEGDLVIKKIKENVESTFNNNVISKFGDFCGFFQLNDTIKNMTNPVLVSSTDGVGTKTEYVIGKLGIKDGLRSLGHDIVNHSINDIIVKGSRPLYFLDYIASSKIDSDSIQYLVEGISDACRKAHIVLLGGETAEMPGVYNKGSFDIVGTIVGIIDKSNILNGKETIGENDLVYGIKSSGPHTNGYSLIRKLIEKYDNDNENNKLYDNQKVDLSSLTNPHRSYLDEVSYLEMVAKIKAYCHITGGGYEGNLSRVLPDDLGLEIKIPITEPFKTLQRIGNISDEEMYKVFNCGYGMILFVNEENESKIKHYKEVHKLGRVKKRDNKKRIDVVNVF